MVSMNMEAGNLMTTEVVTVRDSDPIARVRRLLRRRSFHAVPVVNHWDNLCGIVTCADFVGIGSEEARRPVREVMQRPVYTIPESTDIALVARFMASYRVRHLVVVRGRRVHGILSTFDLLGALAGPGSRTRHSATDPCIELEARGLRLVDTRPASSLLLTKQDHQEQQTPSPYGSVGGDPLPPYRSRSVGGNPSPLLNRP